jgi:lipopolysaccharide transport system ATP-binding protein
MPDAIIVRGLGKQFRRYRADRPMTLQEAVLKGLRRMRPAEHFWALRNVSFSVPSGRMLGVLGPNGAGKSTLLRLIGGVGRPDEGSVNVCGRVGALLDLGAGFHPDLTGRENVFINGVISGLTRREVEQRFDAIVAFAELQEFIDNPLRTYSTGMQMRLAFAVAAHIEPEILLIDEVLAVGDLSFQHKCLERIAQFRAAGCTIILVSHDVTLIQKLCDEALWLRSGQVAAHGVADVVVGQYVAEMSAETRRRTPAARPVLRTPMGTELRINENRFGSLELEISAVRLLDAYGFLVTELKSGDPLRIEIEYLAPQPISAPIFGVTISRGDGFICYDTSTAAAGLTLPALQGEGQIVLHLERLDLNGGEYYVDIGVYERDWAYAYDYHWHVYPLLVRLVGGEKGILRPPHRWEVCGVLPLQASLPALEVH